ncbi:MAG: N-acetyl sugar amidotransferase [Pirellulaceae bacterium]|nr:N-acetyl sugar amidotransferase [Pirellulaceae bacterium]
MQYCTKCVYPYSAVNTEFDRNQVCSACSVAAEVRDGQSGDFWRERRMKFESLLAEYRGKCPGQWDCIIPVSGGKDSYWQAHLMKQYGMKPLLVTYHGNNYLPEGQANLDRMRDVLGIDHLVFGPSVSTLRKLNRLCFTLMGDMNWHAHAGIKIVPMRMAVALQIPLLIWGEITWTVSGMFSPSDFAEYNKRSVLEHDLRGFRIPDMLDKEEDLTEADLAWLRFPSDDEIADLGVRGIYIGNFFPWNPNEHAKEMHDLYGFEFARQPFERTYRTMSNLDDMHENGIHDYLKFIKFGYGRCSDHASKDIRDGYLTRNDAIDLVRKYDHVKPCRDLRRWLEYVGMSENDFDVICDRFRSPKVWWIKDGRWWKDNIWGEPSSYGEVRTTDASVLSKFDIR